jgi:hypothetical protein
MFLVEPGGELSHASLHLHNLLQQSEHRVRDDLQHAPEHVACIGFGLDILLCTNRREYIVEEATLLFRFFCNIIWQIFCSNLPPLFRQLRQVGFNCYTERRKTER